MLSTSVAGGGLFTEARAKLPGALPRVVIVGAGIAGLNTAYHLKNAGLPVRIYEAAARVGGRIFTAADLVGPGLTTELGGEFIDSGHHDLLALVKHLDLDLLDVKGPAEKSLAPMAFFFSGRHYSEREVVEAFRPVAARLREDGRRAGDTINFHRHNPAAVEIDQLSLAEYLPRITSAGWLRNLLEVAYITEFGLDSSQQSALNLVRQIGTDLSHGGLELFGESDERYKIRGGNQQVVEELGRRLQEQIHLEYRLEAIRSRGRGFRLTFAGPNGSPVDIDADIALLCIPFSVLRRVDLQLELPSIKRKAVAELGYGTNAKVIAGFRQRLWRVRGYSGYTFSDEPFQCAWDNSQGQEGMTGGLTFFLGGKTGLEVGKGTPAEQAAFLMEGAGKVYPGLNSLRNGRAARMHWCSKPFSLGSYACYKPGQYTSLAGAEGIRVGNLFFAGEHCSIEFQGFMNGGAQTGRMAAQAVLARAR